MADATTALQWSDNSDEGDKASLFDLLNRPEWHEQAACRGEPTATFYPAHPDRDTRPFHRARAICETCPVKQECLEAGLAREDEGIWGGTSPTQRARLRKKLRAQGRDPRLPAVRTRGSR